MDTKQDLNYILDTFSGADGGGRFVLVKSLIDTLKNQSDAGDKDATKILTIVNQFANLCRHASKDLDKQS